MNAALDLSVAQGLLMDNPYSLTAGIPSITPINLKRRSISKSHKPPLSLPPVPPPQSSTRVKYPYLVLKRGKKHHAFPTDFAPYPLNYEPKVLDLSVISRFAFINLYC